MARPPALCAHCGHDVARGAVACGHCSRETIAWVQAPRGELVEVSNWLTVPLGIAIAVALVLWHASHPIPQVLIGVFVIAALLLVVVLVFYGEASWTASTGASAQTFHGRLTIANGTSPHTIVHGAPGQEGIRGDLLYDGGGGVHPAGLPAALGANAVEISIVAAIMGAVARGRIRLVETRPRHWKRLGAARTESLQRYGGTFAITLLERPHADEDALADLLLGAFYPPVVGDYRGPASGAAGEGALVDADRRTIALTEIVRAAFSAAQKPGRAMRRALPRRTRDPAEQAAIQALLVALARDERAEVWTSFRDALRLAMSQRGRKGT